MIIAFILTASAACPNLEGEIERATASVVAGDFPGARAALSTASGSFACAPATTAQIARYWLIEGATKELGGDSGGARAPFAAARAAAPELFDERLGPRVRSAWAAATVDGRGSLLIEPSRPAFIDGAGVSEWPVSLSATPHLIQIVEGDAVLFGRVIALEDKEDAVVDTGVAAAPRTIAIASATAPVAPKPKKSPALIILASVAAAGAGGCAGAAALQTPVMDSATTTSELDDAWTRQQAFGYSTWGLVGVAAVSLGLHIALP